MVKWGSIGVKWMMVVIFSFQILVQSSAKSDETDQMKKRSKKCLDRLVMCKKNEECASLRREVKRKCSFVEHRCKASHNHLDQCFSDIERLQKFFGASCTCLSYPLKKLPKCTDVYNMIFANPCYDRGLSFREDARRLAAVTMRAAVSTDIDDVADDVISDTPRFDVTNHANGRNPIKNSEVSTTESPKRHPVDDVQIKKPDVTSSDDITEEQLEYIDDLLFSNMHYDVYQNFLPRSRDPISPTDREAAEVAAEVMKETTQQNVDYDVTEMEYEENLPDVIKPESDPVKHDDGRCVINIALISCGLVIIVFVAFVGVYVFRKNTREGGISRNIFKSSCRSGFKYKPGHPQKTADV
ncbi:uncharacterized protein LOC143463362 isoform X1 [Clavelina lepadiformis]|uniref:uncharacterized protein LOC143463362 isoform X1 n=1 Tax=Clavelina lepadiformis TaxID=159417 RepID=UPI004043690F